jgi:hypothetical protein
MSRTFICSNASRSSRAAKRAERAAPRAAKKAERAATRAAKKAERAATRSMGRGGARPIERVARMRVRTRLREIFRAVREND